MKIECILFPTDFSESASRTLPHVMTMADKFDSSVTLLHIPLPYANDSDRPQYLFINEAQYSQYVERQFERLLNELRPNRRVSTVVSKGLAPALGILRYVERNPASILVIGTHGSSAREKFSLGT
ncbi:MAG: universal stress protein, partial [bacterium]